MKKILIAVTALAIATSGCSSDKPDDRQQASVSSGAPREYYTCPMHPTVISDRPGACPVCGMALVRKSSIQDASAGASPQIERVSLSPTQRVLANVSTTPSSRITLRKEIKAVGVVGYAEPLQSTVAARFSGRIERLHVTFTGASVRKGDPLFDLYSPDLISAQQDLILAGRFGVGDENVREKAIPGGLFEAGKTRLRLHYGMTADQIERLEKSGEILQTISFHAPISGTVIRKLVQEGQYIDEGTSLYELANLSRVWIYLDVYEQDLRFMKTGLTATVIAQAYPGETFHGKITFIDPVMNADTRTFRVRTEFSNPEGRLKPLMYVDARINVHIPNAVVVPSSALLSTGERDIVWVEVEKNSFEPREVVVGVRTPIHAQILNGLAESEPVVTSGGYLIDSESQLAVPRSQEQHTAHGSDTQTEKDPAGQSATDSIPLAGFDVNILVKGSYSPSVIRVKTGKPVRLHFFRDEKSACTEEVVFDKLGIRRHLPAFKTTTIEILPSEPGEIHFTCGMNMVHGKLIVER